LAADKQEGAKARAKIIVGVLGVIGSIITALIGAYVGRATYQIPILVNGVEAKINAAEIGAVYINLYNTYYELVSPLDEPAEASTEPVVVTQTQPQTQPETQPPTNRSNTTKPSVETKPPTITPSAQRWFPVDAGDTQFRYENNLPAQSELYANEVYVVNYWYPGKDPNTAYRYIGHARPIIDFADAEGAWWIMSSVARGRSYTPVWENANLDMIRVKEGDAR